MIDRTALTAGLVILLIGLLSPTAAFASVKCQCNNGTMSEAIDADYDDEDVDEACNEACSELGGGRVWNVDTDQQDGDDLTVRHGKRRHEEPTPRR